MSVCDKMTDDKLALIASASRKWSNALSHAGLNPEMHVTASEIGAMTDLMAYFPNTERAMTDDEPFDSLEN